MEELNIVLNPSGEICLYAQIYRHIREEIRAGRLHKGEKLPSTRALSSFLGIARSTVQTAYDQLLSEGYVEARRNRGYYICEISNLFALGTDDRAHGRKPAEPRAPYERMSADAEREQDAGIGRAETADSDGGIAARGKAEGDAMWAATADRAADTGGEMDLIDFSPRRIDMSQFPYQTWKKISRETLVDANSEMFSLGEPNGDLSFREVIARYLYFARGVRCEPEQIVVGAGNDFLLLLLREILGEGRSIAMEYVTYRRACRIFRSVGYSVVPMPMDESGMQVPSGAASPHAAASCSLAYVMPAHQYPSGVTMPIARRMELLAWAGEREDRWIIEDDYDSEFRYRGRPIPSLQASDPLGRVIYIGTFSKSIAPAIRVSYMILPPALQRVYDEKFRFFSSTVSRLDQRQLECFLKEGYFERYLNRMRGQYRLRHDCMLRELRELRGMADRYEVLGEGAGLHLLLRERGGGRLSPSACAAREREMVRAAGAAGVRLYALSENYAAPPEELPKAQRYDPTVLLGYAALTDEQIQEGVRRLGRIL